MTKITNKIINKKTSTKRHKVKINPSNNMADNMISNQRRNKISLKNLMKIIKIKSINMVILELQKLINSKFTKNYKVDL